MDREGTYNGNPLIALAHWLLLNIRTILFFLFENKGVRNLDEFRQWLHDRGCRFGELVAKGFDQLCNAPLVHELNEFLTGLISFSTRNRGQVQYIEHNLRDMGLEEVVGRDDLPPRLREQVEEHLRVLTDRHFESIRTNVDAEPPAIEDPVQPSFEEEMDSSLNSNATCVGPVRRFGGCFKRKEVYASYEGNLDAPSSSSSESGFPPIPEPSRQSEEITVPQQEQQIPDAPESDDELESFSESWIENPEDSDKKVEERQISTSHQDYSQPSTSEQASSSHIQAHPNDYFKPEESQPAPKPEAKPEPIDVRKELYQQVQEAVGKQENNDANVKRIMGVPPVERKFTINHDYQSTSNGCGSMVSGGGGTCAAAVTSFNPFDQTRFLAGNYNNSLEMFKCPICNELIYPSHEVQTCRHCHIWYHDKCFIDSAHRGEQCRNPLCHKVLQSDRKPFH